MARLLLEICEEGYFLDNLRFKCGDSIVGFVRIHGFTYAVQHHT
jgi:hypothetical protein